MHESGDQPQFYSSFLRYDEALLELQKENIDKLPQQKISENDQDRYLGQGFPQSIYTQGNYDTKIKKPKENINQSLLLNNQIVVQKIRKYEDLPFSLDAPRDSDTIIRHNTFAAEARTEYGVGDRRGIDIVALPFKGRTPLERYLGGLAKHNYIVPESEWNFGFTSENRDHDERLHFSRISEIHPDMAEAIATYAAYGLELLSSGDRFEAELMGGRLDIYLSMSFPSYFTDGNEELDIAGLHIAKQYPELTPDKAIEKAKELIAIQHAYEQFVRLRRMENNAESIRAKISVSL